MTRDVLVRIRGLQQMEDDSDTLEMIAPGEYFQKNGKHYVLYDEMIEGYPEPVRNTMKISPDKVEIRKNGVVSTHMVFERNKTDHTHYVTPMGEMMIDTMTTGIDLDEQEDCLQIRVEYAMDINYEHVSDCIIDMAVTSREKAQLKLRTEE